VEGCLESIKAISGLAYRYSGADQIRCASCSKIQGLGHDLGC